MADETISTRIVANADFSSLIADVHKVTASLSKLQEQLANSNKMLANNVAVINRNFSDTLRSTGQFSTHFVSLTSDVEKFGKNLDGGKLKLNQYFNTFRDHTRTSGGLIRDLAKQQVAMQNAVLQPLGRNSQGLMQFNVHVPRGLDAVKNKTAIARQELQIMNKVIQDGAGQLINWGKNTQWAGRQLTVGLTVPLAAFGKAAADAFRVADQELTRLTKVYGDIAGTSVEELGRVRKEVIETSKELSAAYGTNFTETISLAADIAATGKQGQELLDSVKETSRLAVLGEVDRQEAMKATLAIQSAFKQNTDELADSINFLNAVENQTSTTLNDLVEAIPKAGPVIKGLGGSVQDLALYLTAMREGGINASEGANALKSALASLINPTDKAVEKFQGFGIDLLKIVNSNAGNVTATLMDLQAALDRLDPLQKQQAIEQLFGKFQFSRLNALFENLGRQGSQTLQVLDLMKASAADLESVASRELTAVTESASGKYRRALESLKADLAGLGDAFLTINTQIINIVDKALEFFNSLPKPIKQALTFIGALTAVAGPLIMLTGVLANFFGYILKGVGHMKAFFKGGEGWKYLTPEMMAADKAGKLIEQTFYSDAKAASILQLALKNLIDEFSILETKARSGAISVNPAVSTMAGNLVARAGGPRIVDPNNPLVGAMGTRASTHMVARASLTEEQRMQQTIFGLVPGSIPLNQKIGEAPQIYMQDRLPNVPGLTSVGGASTGVVASEAARWHSMTATLAMQSKAEIEALKKQMVATGVLSKDFMNQFDDMLPIISKITDSAARESAVIVAELRAGKLTVEAAKAKIIALNLEVERMIGAAAVGQATSLGRTLNPTMVPTLNQPVVDPTGRSNMRELFKKSKTKDFIDKVARSLGVRTSGAGYNIETTRPRKMNMGGYVYTMNDGNIVPGPNVNADIVPAMLTPGEFVVNAEATRKNLPLLQALNEGGNQNPFLSATMIHQGSEANQALAGNRPGVNLTGTYLANDLSSLHSRGLHPMALFYEQGIRLGYNKSDLKKALTLAYTELESTFRRKGDAPINNTYYEKVATSIAMKHLKTVSRFSPTVGRSVRLAEELIFLGHQRNTQNRGFEPGSLRTTGFDGTQLPRHLVGTGSGFSGSANQAHFNLAQELYDDKPSNLYTGTLGRGNTISQVFGSQRGHIGTKFSPSRWNLLLNMVKNKVGRAPMVPDARSVALNKKWRSGYSSGGVVGLNSGGMVPGVRYMQDGGIASAFTSGLRNPYGKGLASGAMPRMGQPMGMGAQIGIGIGGSIAGSMIGGPVGTAVMLASNLLPLMSGLRGLGGILPLVTKLAGVLGRLTIPGAVIGGAFMLGKFLLDAKKNAEETANANRQAFGMSADVIKRAGYNVADYSANVKKAVEETKALQERNRMLYESMFQAGIPIKMTIAEYKKLRAEVKEGMPELIKLFNQTPNGQTGGVAASLKAQFMALGDNVDTATAKVFALMSQSNKAQLAAAAIGSKGFAAIKTTVDAAIVSATNFDKAISSGEAKAASDALIVTFEGIGNAIDENSKKNKISFGQSMDEVLKKISESGKGQVAITKDVMNELKKQNPELAKILNSTDTATSAWAKYQLALKNVNIDLKNISGEAATAALKLQDLVSTQTMSTLKSTAGIKGQYAAYNALQTQIKNLRKAADGQSAQTEINTRKQTELINKQIDAIKKAADAKIKALRSQAQAENDNLEIQKLQLEYQQALARGDQDAAASAQIALQQFTNQVQTRKAEESIMAKADLQIKPLQDKLDLIGKKNQELADKASLAGDSLGRLQKQSDELASKLRALESAATAAAMAEILNKNNPKYQGSQEQKNNLAAVEAANMALGGPKSVERVIPKGAKARHRVPETFSDVAGGAKDIANTISNQLQTINAKEVNLYTSQINQGGTGGTKSMPKYVGFSNSYNTKSGGILDDASKYKIVNENRLTSGQYFIYDGKTYRVKTAQWTQYGLGQVDVVAQKSLGGPVAAGRKYLVNDRVNSLGFQQEVFVPRVPGNIYPNINTMPKYNIPTNSISGIYGNEGGSQNNNYTINIELNGTNVTADDIMKRFKSEMALINAKEGRSRTVGGK